MSEWNTNSQSIQTNGFFSTQGCTQQENKLQQTAVCRSWGSISHPQVRQQVCEITSVQFRLSSDGKLEIREPFCSVHNPAHRECVNTCMRIIRNWTVLNNLENRTFCCLSLDVSSADLSRMQPAFAQWQLWQLGQAPAPPRTFFRIKR